MKGKIAIKAFCILMIISVLVSGNVLAAEEQVQASENGTGIIEIRYTMLDENAELKTVEKSITTDLDITYGEVSELINANAPAAEFKGIKRLGWSWKFADGGFQDSDKIFEYLFDGNIFIFDVNEKYEGYSLVEIIYEVYTEEGDSEFVSEGQLYQDETTYAEIAADAALTDIRPEFKGLDFKYWKISELYEEYLSDTIGENTMGTSVLMEPATRNSLVRFYVCDADELYTTGSATIEFQGAMVVEKGTKVGAPAATENYQNIQWDFDEIVVQEDVVDFSGVGNKSIGFTDVRSQDWFFDSVRYVKEHGLMKGLNSTTFGPADPLARAQFAVILYRMNGTPQIQYTDRFPDVERDVWYTDAILWAAETNVVTGYSDTGKFGPGDNINREQMAVMMYRYAKYKNYDVSEKVEFSGYVDAASVSEFAEDAMKWAVGSKIITGKDNGTRLDPQGNASRAECATIMMRFIEKYGK